MLGFLRGKSLSLISLLSLSYYLSCCLSIFSTYRSETKIADHEHMRQKKSPLAALLLPPTAENVSLLNVLMQLQFHSPNTEFPTLSIELNYKTFPYSLFFFTTRMVNRGTCIDSVWLEMFFAVRKLLCLISHAVNGNIETMETILSSSAHQPDFIPKREKEERKKGKRQDHSTVLVILNCLHFLWDTLSSSYITYCKCALKYN